MYYGQGKSPDEFLRADVILHFQLQVDSHQEAAWIVKIFLDEQFMQCCTTTYVYPVHFTDQKYVPTYVKLIMKTYVEGQLFVYGYVEPLMHLWIREGMIIWFRKWVRYDVCGYEVYTKCAFVGLHQCMWNDGIWRFLTIFECFACVFCDVTRNFTISTDLLYRYYADHPRNCQRISTGLLKGICRIIKGFLRIHWRASAQSERPKASAESRQMITVKSLCCIPRMIER